MSKAKYIGVLDIQGAVEEHCKMLETIDVAYKKVKYPDEIINASGLIIPGGESTTLNTIINRYGLKEAIEVLKKRNIPVFGTCAGLILMAKRVFIINPDGERVEVKNYSFGFIDIDVIRNAYGRQKDSFEAPLEVMLDNKKYIFEGVFIRAPVISAFGKNVEVLSWLEREGEKQPVFVKQDNFIATSFHPELTDNPLIHKFFAKLCGF